MRHFITRDQHRLAAIDIWQSVNGRGGLDLVFDRQPDAVQDHYMDAVQNMLECIGVEVDPR